jgi:hypothetical protein
MDITVKIVNYDESTHSLTVSFTDGTHSSSNLSFQTFNYPNKTTEELLKAIAYVGIDTLKREKIREDFKKRKDIVSDLKSLINTSKTYNMFDIIDKPDDNGLEVSV